MSAQGTESPKPSQRRRNSLQHWMHAVDTVELMNWLMKKYGRAKTTTKSGQDHVDGQPVTPQEQHEVKQQAQQQQSQPGQAPKGETVFMKIVDQSMVGTGIAQKAAVFTREGEILAQKNMALTPEQIKYIVKNIAEPQNFSTKGLELGSDKFFYTSSKPGVTRGKDKNEDLCTVAATKHLVIILVYTKKTQDMAEEMVTDLQKYLRDQGV